ncbi:MAG: YidC/Oxa1 family membrane protein insertase [Roseiflexus sp.]
MPIWLAFVEFLQQVLLTFYQWTGSAGFAIILFTIVARLVILPLTIKSLQSSRKMQELQPHMKELQRKYGKDPQKLQEETMRLYREYKVNPVGGCLPMLLQLPIFLGVYQAVINLTRVSPAEHAGSAMLRVLNEQGIAVGVASATLGQPQLAGSFLWLPDLGKTDPYYILPILSVIFQLIVQLMATPRVQDPQQKAMMQSMLILPIVFGYIGFIFPSGAVLYWVVGSILSIIQQYVISGWGSLANYLKFLPTDGGLFPPVTPPSVQAAAPSTGSGSASATDEPAQKVDFWDVLRPLTEARSGTGESPSQATESVAPSEVQQGAPRRRRVRR